MNRTLKWFVEVPHYWKVLITLALATIIIMPFSTPIGQVLILMVNAYALVAFGAMLNRSSTKNSWVYHGAVLLLNSVASYWVFQNVNALVTSIGLTYFLIIAYIAATLWGNFTGSGVSIFLEKKLGVTTKLKSGGNDVSSEEKKVKYALLIILGVMTIVTLIVTKSDYLAAVSVFFLNFLNMGIHTFVRRSRNVGNTLFHNSGLLLQGLSYFLLFRFIAQEQMSWIFFMPYAMGSILGGLLTHTFNMWAEKKIKADPDKHLVKPQNKSSRFAFDLTLFPWKTLLVLLIASAVMIFLAESPGLAALVVGLAVAQYIAFTLISRARTRKSRTYEAYSSIASNGTWLAMFGKLNMQGWSAPLFLPYVAGVMIGGNLGVGIAQHIERWFGISSD
jgi:hypothetical protein